MPLPAIFSSSSSLPCNPPKPTPTEKPWLSSSSSSASGGGGIAGVRVPTAPWMTSPLILPSDEVLDLSKPRKNNSSADGVTIAYRSLTSGVRGGRSREAMGKILKSVSRLRKSIPSPPATEEDAELGKETAVVNFASILNELCTIAASEGADGRGRKEPWAAAKEEKVVLPKRKKERMVTKAEMVLPTAELAKLREEAAKMRVWVKGKKAGITPEVMKGIQNAWKKNALAMVKIVEPLCKNMVRAHEIVETKTGGLVVWRKNDVIVIHRGGKNGMVMKPLPSPPLTPGVEQSSSNVNAFSSSTTDHCITSGASKKRETLSSFPRYEFSVTQRDYEPVKESLYVKETNRVLDELGPRFIDWWQHKPLPVDADLLPEIIHGFMTPFRLCPPNVRQKLSDDELTYLRKLARPMPTHFALGKNRKLQGLASAILKLWEKSPIAKIAIKVGIRNTNSEQMASELKRLTGGVLILRNKFIIILFRGKDFLSNRVAKTVLEREAQVGNQQLLEEKARSKGAEAFNDYCTSKTSSSMVGTFREFQEIRATQILENGTIFLEKTQIEAEIEKLKKTFIERQRSLNILNFKMKKSEKTLAKLNSLWSPSAISADQELLTEEERESLRKIGLKMDEVLLLGRRGIYDGVLASIYQHWKHREVVKVITMQRSIQHITHAAKLLEIESEGIVVAVEPQGRGHAIVLYRGRNYRQPLNPRPQNLLTKSEALQRSIEAQRRGSLRFFVKEKQQSIWELNGKLRNLEQRLKNFNATESQHPGALN
ncbi:hypothetical protein HPP92_006086 [Vanilla planifolia]|uniref:CRM domain-containing protein n=1 Tax=Vanilla planifolia TaxID=51239 RepID=A0A835S0T3_VANPL|nr:hypothetical protein HPP92_006402 [Vanilla planifolia]KAG0495092.1 hypothetical protein HPP92_006086 [Vanilla planifolia]